MPDRPDDTAATAALRRQAEERWRAQTAALRAPVPADAAALLHELQVHQIELEMQNDELRRTQSALEVSRARYFELYERAPVGYLTLSEAGLVLEANLTAARLLGVARAAVISRPLSAYVVREDQDTWYRHFRELLASSGPVPWEMRFVREGGAPFWARLEAVMAAGTRGAERVCLLTASDVTDRKRAEEQLGFLNAGLELQVQQRTGELGVANTELEAFSYSVSHDLRAPLRAIDGFSAMLVEGCGAGLDDEGRRLVGVIRGNVRKMSRLIDDLLAFSRIGRGEVLPDRVAMGDLARAAFDEVVGDPAARVRIDFTVGDLPTVVGDPALLLLVWVNLLSNAVKFSSRRERATIQVSGACEGDQAVFHVRDDGDGFDMRFADKLFGVFERLHATSEFDGTGIGLALVRRVVARHGGKVWAQGAVGEGAEFSFSLPLKP